MKITKKFVFFWDGIYSQWTPDKIQIDRTYFSSCEQYMMYSKAKLFGDHEAEREIMYSKSPMEQKEIGRRIKNFDRDVWDRHCAAIVYRGNYAKFSGNLFLKKELLDTGNRIIVEASPYDKIWGIGMGEDEKGIEDPANWKGLNLLGQIIMNVREVLR